jgi:hypothetical protein
MYKLFFYYEKIQLNCFHVSISCFQKLSISCIAYGNKLKIGYRHDDISCFYKLFQTALLVFMSVDWNKFKRVNSNRHLLAIVQEHFDFLQEIW